MMIFLSDIIWSEALTFTPSGIHFMTKASGRAKEHKIQLVINT